MVPDPEGRRAKTTGRERDGRPDGGVGRRTAMATLGGSALLVGASVLGGVGERLVRTAVEGEDGRRNLVFVISDDHRYDFMSVLDEPGTPEFLATPHFDRIAREGAHLKNAFVTTSLCSPSRASVLTGQYAHQHGVIGNQHRLEGDVTFFPEMLREAGYETAFVGKWHMGHANADPRPGFDRWVSFPGQGRYVDRSSTWTASECDERGT